MKTELDKKYRRTEIFAGLILLVSYLIWISIKFGIIDTSGIFIPDIALLVTGIFLLAGKNKMHQYRKIIGAFLAVYFVIEASLSAMTLIDLNSFSGRWLFPQTLHYVTGVIGIAVCALTCLYVIRWKNRTSLLIFLYAFIILDGFSNYKSGGVYFKLLTVVFFLCLFPENKEEGCRKGTAGRCGIWLFIPAMILFCVISIYPAFISMTAHIFEEEADAAMSQAMTALMMAFIPLAATVLVMPLILFDKKFPVIPEAKAETAESTEDTEAERTDL